MSNNWNQVASIIKKSGVTIIPTDTLYGIVASAFSKKAVARIYMLKGRDKSKPCIVLISSISDLNKFGVAVTQEQKKFLASVWPGKVSVILPCPSNRFKYLHRGTKTIAFRMIGSRNGNLYGLLKKVGPLVAPSANPQGRLPTKSMWEAKEYFGDKVDIYACGHTKASKPSTLIEYKKGKWNVLRQGVVQI